MSKVAGKFFQHVLPGIVRPLHVLWNQVIGFFFIAIACIPIPSAIKEMREPEHYPRLFLSIPFILIMGGFGIHSFLRARKVSRS